MCVLALIRLVNAGPAAHKKWKVTLERRDPAHPEHDELKEWIGRPFDPAAFDVAEINQWLNHTES